MKIERLYAVTGYLLNHGRTSARELAKRFEVSVRTIQRDIDSLCLAGIQMCIRDSYTCIPFWEETEPDYFFIPHEDLKAEFMQKGIPEEKLIVSGIPVARRFTIRQDKAQARRQLGLPEDGRIFLIMTGSMGYGNIDLLLSELLSLCGAQDHIVVLGGNNEAIKSALRETFYGTNTRILD